MTEANEVEALIVKVLNDVREELPESARFTASTQTVLLGPQSELDSLALVSFLVDLDGALNESFGLNVSLLDAHVSGADAAAWSDVESLTAHVVGLLKAT